MIINVVHRGNWIVHYISFHLFCTFLLHSIDADNYVDVYSLVTTLFYFKFLFQQTNNTSLLVLVCIWIINCVLVMSSSNLFI